MLASRQADEMLLSLEIFKIIYWIKLELDNIPTFQSYCIITLIPTIFLNTVIPYLGIILVFFLYLSNL